VPGICNESDALAQGDETATTDWKRRHLVGVWRLTRAVQPVATVANRHISISQLLSLWRHLLLSWPRPPLRTYVRYVRTPYAFNI